MSYLMDHVLSYPLKGIPKFNTTVLNIHTETEVPNEILI